MSPRRILAVVAACAAGSVAGTTTTADAADVPAGSVAKSAG